MQPCITYTGQLWEVTKWGESTGKGKEKKRKEEKRVGGEEGRKKDLQNYPLAS